MKYLIFVLSFFVCTSSFAGDDSMDKIVKQLSKGLIRNDIRELKSVSISFDEYTALGEKYKERYKKLYPENTQEQLCCKEDIFYKNSEAISKALASFQEEVISKGGQSLFSFAFREYEVTNKDNPLYLTAYLTIYLQKQNSNFYYGICNITCYFINGQWKFAGFRHLYGRSVSILITLKQKNDNEGLEVWKNNFSTSQLYKFPIEAAVEVANSIINNDTTSFNSLSTTFVDYYNFHNLKLDSGLLNDNQIHIQGLKYSFKWMQDSIAPFFQTTTISPPTLEFFYSIYNRIYNGGFCGLLISCNIIAVDKFNQRRLIGNIQLIYLENKWKAISLDKDIIGRVEKGYPYPLLNPPLTGFN